MDRLSKVCASLQSLQPFSDANVCNTLFHYTYNSKKEKIVGTNEIVLNLSRVDKFLDKNEGYQILEPYYHACGHLYEIGAIDKDFYLILRGINEKDIQSHFSNVWVACFSKNGNSEFMKRRYAAGDGWILGISFDRLHTVDTGVFSAECNSVREDNNEFEGDFSLYEVRYSFEEMFEFIKKSLYDYYKIYESKQIYDDKTKEEIVVDITNWLEELCLYYKSPLYEREEEIRLVCKLESKFSSWEDCESGIKIETIFDGDDANIKMVLDKKWLTFESQNLKDGLNTKLNKVFITGKKIKTIIQRLQLKKISILKMLWRHQYGNISYN